MLKRPLRVGADQVPQDVVIEASPAADPVFLEAVAAALFRSTGVPCVHRDATIIGARPEGGADQIRDQLVQWYPGVVLTPRSRPAGGEVWFADPGDGAERAPSARDSASPPSPAARPDRAVCGREFSAAEASPPVQAPDSWQIVRMLRGHGVEFVLFGSGGSRAYGGTTAVGDLDICPDPAPENLERLATCLTRLDAKPIVGERGVPAGQRDRWEPRPASPENLDHRYETDLGPLDVVMRPYGPAGEHDRFTFAQLRARATTRYIAGERVYVARIRDLMASKLRGTGPKERRALAELLRLEAETADDSGAASSVGDFDRPAV